MKDGFIGLVKGPAYSSAALIRRCNLQIEEQIDSSGEYRSLTNAKVSITNLDIDSSSSKCICSVRVDLAYFEDETTYLTPYTYVPARWQALDTLLLSVEGITGNDNSISFIVKNIPTNANGYYHKFRFTFLTSDNEIAQCYYEMGSNYTAAMSKREITITTNPAPFFIENEITGFSVELLNSSDTVISAGSIPICANKTASLTIVSDVPFIGSYYPTDVAKVRFAKTNYLYGFGLDGKGEIFNGITDYKEIFGVPNVTAEVLKGTWSSEDDANKILSGNSTRIQFDNIIEHPSFTTTYCDGTVTEISKLQANATDYYVIMLFISKSGEDPVNLYPDPAEPNGIWYRIKEVPAIKMPYNKRPKIIVDLYNLPEAKYVGFWVGAMTKRISNTTITNDIMPTDKTGKTLFRSTGGITVGGTAQTE